VDRIAVGRVEIEYEIRGSGEMVMLVHHGAGADWFRPLMEEPALARRHRLLLYHRPGYAGSGPLDGPLTFAGEAATLRGLAGELGLDRVHVVGHSASGCMALQMALDAPDLVHSVALLEPALMAVASPPEVPEALKLFRAGERTAAIDTFLRGTCGAGYRRLLEAVVPDALEQALADSETFFNRELPALRAWSFGPQEASRVKQPVLAVLGDRSDYRFRERHELLLEWLPNVESFVLSGAGHLLHLEQPGRMADCLASFFARHPVRTRT
jgi:3-oxoadipate enol-lactonase